MFPNLMQNQDTKDVVFMEPVPKIIHETFTRTFMSSISTGVYDLDVYGGGTPKTIKVVLAAIGTLFYGTCFLIDGNDLGVEKAKDLWLVMTNYHVCSDPNQLKAASCFICGQEVILHPDLFFRFDTNQKDGLDYILVAISTDTKTKLERFGIQPNRISQSRTNFFGDDAILIHKPHISSGHLYTSCKIVKRTVKKTSYSYTGFPSSGGSSGSPVFGTDESGNVFVQGLHRAHGVCVNMSCIREDIKKKINA
jgi:hypothetical protein